MYCGVLRGTVYMFYINTSDINSLHIKFHTSFIAIWHVHRVSGKILGTKYFYFLSQFICYTFMKYLKRIFRLFSLSGFKIFPVKNVLDNA